MKNEGFTPPLPESHGRKAMDEWRPYAKRIDKSRGREPAVTAGFTMVEMVVMISILTAISAIVLFSFTGLNQGAALNRSIRELALALRRAQNMSLAVSQIEVGEEPNTAILIPPAVGVRLAENASSYFLFADLGGSKDNLYSGSAEKIGSELLFERGVTIESLKDQAGTEYDLIHILFTAPEATITLSDKNGALLGANSVEIILVPPAGEPKKTITVRTSGQISIK